MKAGTDQQAEGSQEQPLPGFGQATAPTGEQTPPGEAGKGGESGIKFFTQEEADAYAKKHADKTHGKLRSQLSEKEKWLNLVAYEYPQLQARAKELEDLIKQSEEEGTKKNPDLAEINRIKREYDAKARELKQKEEALRFSYAEHADDIKAAKEWKARQQAEEVAKEFGVDIEDILATSPTSEEQMRAIAETLNKRLKGAEQKKTDSGIGGGVPQEKDIHELPMDQFSEAWRKKHPIK